MKQGDSEMAAVPEAAVGGCGDLVRESVRPVDCAAIREAWDAMYSKWPDGPPHEADAIRAANPGPFPDSAEEIRRSRDLDWAE